MLQRNIEHFLKKLIYEIRIFWNELNEKKNSVANGLYSWFL